MDHASLTSWVALIGGGVQVGVLVLLSFIGLTLRSKIRESEISTMSQVRREFVAAETAVQQFASTNLLLTNLGGQVEKIQVSVGAIDQRLARVEGKLDVQGRGRKRPNEAT